jgi:hypothetical protein
MLAQSGDAAEWLVLLGALGGVLLTGLFGLGTVIVTNRRQRERLEAEQAERLAQARREERREAYLEAKVAASNLTNTLDIAEVPPRLELIQEIEDMTSAQVFALLPPDVVSANAQLELATLKLELFGGGRAQELFQTFISEGLAGYLVGLLLGLPQSEVDDLSSGMYDKLRERPRQWQTILRPGDVPEASSQGCGGLEATSSSRR